MQSITIVGRGNEESLKDLKNFIAAVKKEKGLFLVFVMGPAHDFTLGSIFKIRNAYGQGTSELVAITQQFDMLWNEIPHGWKTICAFRPLDKHSASAFEELPFTNSWYNNKIELILEAI